jgi:dTDP-4-amino-4,6-dideoxygalactose transaminase
MGTEERALLLEAFDSNWFATLGPHVDAFERELAARVGAGQAAALSSGTAGLHLALVLLGVGPGDEVVVSDLTFAATANVVRYVGATPIFVDSDPASWTIDPALLAETLAERDRRGRRPRAVIAVDLYGQCADYDRINEVCARYEIPVIQDAAEALGAQYKGKPAGTQGIFGVFSFNANKILTTSGGGMLVSDNAAWIAEARNLACQARDPAPHYEHSKIGYNYRLSNLLAAVGRGQLRLLDDRVAARRKNFEFYRRHLERIPGWRFMPEPPTSTSTRWLTCATIDPAGGLDREILRKAMEAADIEARPVWKPMHLQPVFAGCPMVGGAVDRQLFETGICLPSGSNLGDADRTRIMEVIQRVLRERGLA